MHGETAVSDVRCAATAGISHYVSDGSELPDAAATGPDKQRTLNLYQCNKCSIAL